MQDNTNLLLVGGLIIAAGVIIAVKFFSKKEPDKRATPTDGQQEHHGNSTKVEVPTSTPLDKITSAKDAFIKNISMFVPLLPKLQHGIMDSKEWNSVILSINNPNLTSDWEKRCNLPIQRWIDKLASWGVSCEKCTAFKGNKYYADKYEITSDPKMIEGKQYEVIDWYWVLTSTNAEGITEKKIILKGKAK